MKVSQITIAEADGVELELADGVHAGFPSPAQDYAGDKIDLVRELNAHPETTFYARVSGDSMVEAGIFDGDILVVDRSLTPRDGNFVIAFVDGEFTLKEYKADKSGHGAWLIPHNELYKPIFVSDEEQFAVWGVVTYNVHRLCTH